MPQLLAYHGNRETCGWKLSCHKIDSLFCGSKSVLGQISFIAHVWRLSVFCIVAETALMFHTCETALMFHTLWSERDLDFVFSPNFNSLWLSARAYGFLRWCRRAKKIIHIETEANVKHQNRLHLLVKENHMVHQKMPRESKNMQKVATRTCPQEKVSNTRMHKLSIDNVDIYISLSLS